MSLIKYFHGLLDPVLQRQRTPAHILRYPPAQCFASHAPPPAPIIGLLTRTPHALSAHLLTQGFIVRPVVPPTVPPGEERVRVCLRAGIDQDVVKRLVAAIEQWTVQRIQEEKGSSSAGAVGSRVRAQVEMKAKL